ncbi:MAG TPA: zinc ABC transporter substrate-binding protein [Cellulomonas sp.]
MPPRPARAALVATATLVVLAACASSPTVPAATSGTAAGPTPWASGTRLAVVASTNVWGDVVGQVGGDLVAVTSIISDPSADPHSYEANARTQLAISQAALIVANGGGYDDFVDTMVGALATQPPVIHAVDVIATGEDNEHVWYDLPGVQKVADTVATQLGTLDPEHAATYAGNATAFDRKVAGVEQQVADLKAAHAGAPVAITEPVPLYLLDEAGLVNVTPPAFSAAVEDETDVPPAVLADTLALFRDHAVDALVYNAQTTGPQTEQVLTAAHDADIPVVPVTETLPAGTDYVGWMSANVTAIAGALGR